MRTQAEIEEWFCHPPPGSKAAAAREFGIDLTLTLINLRQTPEQRLLTLQRFAEQIDELRRALQRSRQT